MQDNYGSADIIPVKDYLKVKLQSLVIEWRGQVYFISVQSFENISNVQNDSKWKNDQKQLEWFFRN